MLDSGVDFPTATDNFGAPQQQTWSTAPNSRSVVNYKPERAAPIPMLRNTRQLCESQACRSSASHQSYRRSTDVSSAVCGSFYEVRHQSVHGSLFEYVATHGEREPLASRPDHPVQGPLTGISSAAAGPRSSKTERSILRQLLGLRKRPRCLPTRHAVHNAGRARSFPTGGTAPTDPNNNFLLFPNRIIPVNLLSGGQEDYDQYIPLPNLPKACMSFRFRTRTIAMSSCSVDHNLNTAHRSPAACITPPERM